MRILPSSHFALIAACLGLYNGMAAPQDDRYIGSSVSRPLSSQSSESCPTSPSAESFTSLADCDSPPRFSVSPTRGGSLTDLFPNTHALPPLVKFPPRATKMGTLPNL